MAYHQGFGVIKVEKTPRSSNTCSIIEELKEGLVKQIIMCNYRAFRDRSMKLGNMLEHTIRQFCGYRDI